MYWGQVTSPQMGDKISVTVIATGFDNEQNTVTSEVVPEPKVEEPVINDPNVVKANELDSILHVSRTPDPIEEKKPFGGQQLSEPFSFESNPDKDEKPATWGPSLFEPDSEEEAPQPVHKTVQRPATFADPNDLTQPAIWTEKYGRGINLSE